MKYLLIIIIIIFYNYSYGQNTVSVNLGMSAGGPVPNKTVMESYGKLSFLPKFGLSYNTKISEDFSINNSLYYQINGASYGKKYQNDTLVPLPINESILIPTYYKAQVDGKMRLHYIQYSPHIQYNKYKPVCFTLGTYISYLHGGYDKGNVHITIGEGGFFDDIYDKYNNFNQMNKVDLGFSTYFRIDLPYESSVIIGVQRSLKSLFKTFPMDDEDKPKLFLTNIEVIFSKRIT